MPEGKPDAWPEYSEQYVLWEQLHIGTTPQHLFKEPIPECRGNHHESQPEFLLAVVHPGNQFIGKRTNYRDHQKEKDRQGQSPGPDDPAQVLFPDEP